LLESARPVLTLGPIKSETPVSKFAFKFNLYRYAVDQLIDALEVGGAYKLKAVDP
jgi:hypothetical protein